MALAPENRFISSDVIKSVDHCGGGADFGHQVHPDLHNQFLPASYIIEFLWNINAITTRLPSARVVKISSCEWISP